MKAKRICLSLDIGATNIKHALVSEDALLKDFEIVPTDRSLGPMGLVDQICEIYKAKTKDLGPNIALGLSCAGPLDPVEGRLLVPANLTDGRPEWSNFPLVKELVSRLKVKVDLENDAASAALGELWVGKGKGLIDFMVFTLGTGLGTAIVRDAQVVRAAGGLHTELGHLIIDYNDVPVVEGVKVQGSLESYLGPKFFLKKVSESFGRSISGEDFVSLVLQKDPSALKCAQSYKDVLISGMFNFFLAFAPELYVFQGGFSPLIEVLKSELNQEIAKKVEGFSRPERKPPTVEISDLSRTCGVYGAAYRVFFKCDQ